MNLIDFILEGFNIVSSDDLEDTNSIIYGHGNVSNHGVGSGRGLGIGLGNQGDRRTSSSWGNWCGAGDGDLGGFGSGLALGFGSGLELGLGEAQRGGTIYLS